MAPSPLILKISNSLQRYKQIAETPETLQERTEAMSKMMIDITQFENTPPCQVCDPKECILAREIYEYATFLSVERKDIPDFERNICILRSYYDEFEGVIPTSQKKWAIVGLYLLYLLSFNKISQYHTEIELISQEEIDNNVYIKVPVSLETYFVQGSYQKILTQQQNVPLVAYNFFIEKFVDAIRYEIARSAECSYDSLSLVDMQKMFMIANQAELMAFIQHNQKDSAVEWAVKGDRLHFVREKKEMAEIPNHKMINLTLSYATELNRII